MYTLLTVKLLLQNNIDTELYCLKNSRLNIEANKEGIKTITAESSGYFKPGEIFRLKKEIDSNNYDIIHSGASQDLWIIVPALKLAQKKTPLLFTKHIGSFIIKKDILHRWIYNRVTYALAISKVIQKNLVDTCPLPPQKVKLLHNGIDSNKFDPAKGQRDKIRNELSVAQSELLIGMTARFSPGKGHEEFLYAAKILSEKYDNLKFMIVGEPSKNEDSYADEIKKLTSDYKLSNVIFTGYRKDMPDILSALDIFVFPSHSEAFGLALVEAMAMEAPSVCTSSDGVLDIAVDGETSLLFKKQDREDLTGKLEILIREPDKRNAFGKAARKRVLENFDIKIFLANLRALYNEVVHH